MSEAYLHVTSQPNPSNPEATQAYLKGVLPLLLKAGGEVLARTKLSKTIHGTSPGAMTLAMRFPDAASIEAVFDSAPYKDLTAYRDAGFLSMSIHIGHPL